jgi:hypothetical protein
MKQLLTVVFLLTLLTKTTAQTDSSGFYDVYRNETQQSLAPALSGDMGKHIVRSDFRFLKRSTDGDYHPLQYWQAAWQTGWKNHGLGVIYKSIPSSQLISSRTFGLQYAYGFKMGKSNFWKNSRMSFGLGMYLTKEQARSDHFIMNDQFLQATLAKPSSSEPPADKPIYYPEFDAGLAFRSKKFYLVANFINLTSPQQGLYKTTNSIKAFGVNISTGVKLAEWKKLAGRVVCDAQTSEFSTNKIGLSLSYQHLIASWKMSSNHQHLFQLSYMHPRIRAYAQYETIHNSWGTFHGAFISTGLAIGLTKQ